MIRNSMDTHRVYGYVLETLGKYNSAIQQYQEAARINPNMTFLYVRIGQNFREGIRNPDRALEYFDRAAKINQALGVQNPLPISKLPAPTPRWASSLPPSINAEKALELDPTNATHLRAAGDHFPTGAQLRRRDVAAAVRSGRLHGRGK